MYDAFEDSAYEPDSLKNEGFSGEWIAEFQKVASDNISIPFVDIKGQIIMTSWLPDGIKYIREALILGEKSEYEDVDIKIKYIGAPRYLITVKAPDYKIAEEEMKKAINRTTEHIHKYSGECEFKREIEE